MGLPMMASQNFGRALAIKCPEDGVLGICLCYGPGDLENGEPMPKGGHRWFSIVAQNAQALEVLDPRKMSPAVLERSFSLAAADMDEHHAEQPPHWYVHILGVASCARGKKLSRKLLGVVFRWADDAGVHTYLECGGVNVPVYQALGFDEVWEETLDADGSSIS